MPGSKIETTNFYWLVARGSHSPKLGKLLTEGWLLYIDPKSMVMSSDHYTLILFGIN